MGDKAERIAEMAIQLAGSESKFPHHELEHMAELVRGMLHDALDAFARMTLENLSVRRACTARTTENNVA
ncbi:MAG: hypothetical protein WCP96_05270 [Methylococcaceae bacterium]